MKIGVFDSGVGGLTVLNKLVNIYPNNEYIYFGDTKNTPYGSKTKEELKLLSSNIVDFLVSNKVDLIIIACGTVSSNVYDYLKEKYNVNIVDIISPVISYINNSNYNKIGVIATEATINSNIFSKTNKLIDQVACKEFVPIIESSNYDKLDEYLELYLNKLKEKELIVLGCTHYPIIKEQINNYFNNKIRLLDMSECLPNIANDGISKVDLYFSKLDDNILNNINNILECNIDSINII